MKHYRDAQNNVYAYEEDGSQDKFILPGLTPITVAQANALRAPVATTPQSVTRFQARAALARAGLFTTVNSAMVAFPIDDERRLAWEDAQEFRRTSPTMLQMAAALGLTDAQLDELFTTAAGIEA